MPPTANPSQILAGKYENDTEVASIAEKLRASESKEGSPRIPSLRQFLQVGKDIARSKDRLEF